jgi:hypothetical protein
MRDTAAASPATAKGPNTQEDADDSNDYTKTQLRIPRLPDGRRIATRDIVPASSKMTRRAAVDLLEYASTLTR